MITISFKEEEDQAVQAEDMAGIQEDLVLQVEDMAGILEALQMPEEEEVLLFLAFLLFSLFFSSSH